MADNPFYSPPVNVLQALTLGMGSYEGARKRGFEDELGQALSSGQIDYRAAAGIAARSGKPELALGLVKLGEDKAAQQAFQRDFGGFLGGVGGGGQPQPTPAPQSPLASLAMPQQQPTLPSGPIKPNLVPTQSYGSASPGNPLGRPTGAVPSSSRVMGDQEAIDAGIYEGTPQQPPQRVAQAVPQPPQAALDTVRTNPATNNILGLAAIMSHPGASAGQRKTAEILLGEAVKTPGNVQEYQAIAKQEAAAGRPVPSLMQWTLDKERAKATLINTAPGLEAAQTTARIKLDTDTIEPLAKQVASGRKALPLLEHVIDLANKTPGGWAGQAAPTIAKALSTFGFEVPDNISNAELFAAITRQMIPGVRDPGATSNYEQQLYAQGVPNLAQSPEGKIKVAELNKAMLQRGAEIVKIYRQNLGKPELDDLLAKLDNTPIFSKEQRQSLESVSRQPTAAPKPQQRAPQTAPPVPDAQQAPDGNWYVPDPKRPGKYLRVDSTL